MHWSKARIRLGCVGFFIGWEHVRNKKKKRAKKIFDQNIAKISRMSHQLTPVKQSWLLTVGWHRTLWHQATEWVLPGSGGGELATMNLRDQSYVTRCTTVLYCNDSLSRFSSDPADDLPHPKHIWFRYWPAENASDSGEELLFSSSELPEGSMENASPLTLMPEFPSSGANYQRASLDNHALGWLSIVWGECLFSLKWCKQTLTV